MLQLSVKDIHKNLLESENFIDIHLNCVTSKENLLRDVKDFLEYCKNDIEVFKETVNTLYETNTVLLSEEGNFIFNKIPFRALSAVICETRYIEVGDIVDTIVENLYIQYAEDTKESIYHTTDLEGIFAYSTNGSKSMLSLVYFKLKGHRNAPVDKWLRYSFSVDNYVKILDNNSNDSNGQYNFNKDVFIQMSIRSSLDYREEEILYNFFRSYLNFRVTHIAPLSESITVTALYKLELSNTFNFRKNLYIFDLLSFSNRLNLSYWWFVIGIDILRNITIVIEYKYFKYIVRKTGRDVLTKPVYLPKESIMCSISLTKKYYHSVYAYSFAKAIFNDKEKFDECIITFMNFINSKVDCKSYTKYNSYSTPLDTTYFKFK